MYSVSTVISKEWAILSKDVPFNRSCGHLGGKMLLLLQGLSPLQIQLLVFVKLGLATPYDLITQAGLSVGLTSPALKRLEEAGLLASTPGSRRSMRYALTEKGEKQLKGALETGGPLSWLIERSGTLARRPVGLRFGSRPGGGLVWRLRIVYPVAIYPTKR